MKHFKIYVTLLTIFITGSIYAQDNIINEIAKGGKFIVRDVEQNEAMVIVDGNVGFSGTLKLGVLPEGNTNNSIVVWDSDDKKLKIINQNFTQGFNDTESWHTFGYDGLADDNTTTVSASIQGTAAVAWNQFDTDYGCIKLGPAGTAWAHIYTDRARFIFNKPIFVKKGKISAHIGSNLSLRTYFTTRLTILASNGNVGIGTTNPSTKLDVNGTAMAKRYVANGIHEITNSVWDLSQGNLAQITFTSGITPITINSDGSVGTYVLVVKKNTSCTDCNIYFSGADVKYPSGVNPTLSSGANTTDIFSFIAVGNNTFYCLYAKNLL